MVGLVLVQLVWKAQTDWMGGPGVLGPVSDWGTQYWRGDSITTATEGQVSLIATEWDYTAWAKHVLEAPGTGGTNHGMMGETVFHEVVDINGDGLPDLLGAAGNLAICFENTGDPDNWIRHDIGAAGTFDGHKQTYPVDIDGDGDMDLLMAMNDLYLWLNDGSGGFDSVRIAPPGAPSEVHWVSAADFDGDGDLDLLVIDNSANGWYQGDFWVYWNDGGLNFMPQKIADAAAFRGYPAHFNSDSLPDFYGSRYIFINQGGGVFTEVVADGYCDGVWAEDIDMDGDVDLVANSGSGAYLNDGQGNFTYINLPVSGGDGAIARDIDLDGLPDIADVYSTVRWFRQLPTSQWPDDPQFQEYLMDNAGSHWIYAQDLDGGCMPDVDILIANSGAYFLYENQMLQSFASYGYLESSVLEMDSTPGYGGHPLEFYYKACVPNDSALEFWFRGGATVEQCTSSTWIGPFRAQAGVDSASFDITSYFGTTRYFQYKAVFRGDTSQDKDIAVLYEVGLAYEPGLAISEKLPKLPSKLAAYIAGRSTLKLELPYSSKVKIEVYEPTGRLIARIEKALQAGVHEVGIPGKGLRLVRVGAGGREVSLKAF